MGFDEFHVLNAAPRDYREGRMPDIEVFLEAIAEWADACSESGEERVELSADQFKLLADYANGKVKRPARRPRKGAPERLREQMLNPLYWAAIDFHRYKQVWAKRYGVKYRVNEPALEKAAHRNGVTTDQLWGRVRRSKRSRKSR